VLWTRWQRDLLIVSLEAGFEGKDRPIVVLLQGSLTWRRVMIPIAEAGFHIVAGSPLNQQSGSSKEPCPAPSKPSDYAWAISTNSISAQLLCFHFSDP
jgi:hypothetical protein